MKSWEQTRDNKEEARRGEFWLLRHDDNGSGSQAKRNVMKESC